MKITETWTYVASPDRVWEMLTDPEFQERKCAASGALCYDAKVETTGDGRTTITVNRTMPTEDIPAQIRKLLKGGLEVEEVQTWSAADDGGSRSGTVQVTIKGTPAAMKGTISLVGQGESTEMSMDADLKAGVPLVGGKIEQAAAPAIIGGVRVEAQEGAAYLEN